MWLCVVLWWGLVVVLQEIDGKAFMLLNSEMMMKYMGLKLGPVLKLCNIIEKLRSRLKWCWAEFIMLTQAPLIHASTACPFRCNIFCCCLVVHLHHSLDTGSIHAGYTTNSCVSQMICVDRFHCSMCNEPRSWTPCICLSVLSFLCYDWEEHPKWGYFNVLLFSSTHVNTHKHTHIHMHARMRTRTHAHTHTRTHAHTQSYILPCHSGSYALTSGET